MSQNALRTSLTIVGLVTAFALAGCMQAPMVRRSADGGGAAAGDYTVRMKDIKYDPPTLNVGVGSTVTWVNEDPLSHTVTPVDKVLWGSQGSGEAMTSWLPQGGSWTFTFTKAGTYVYYCIPHAFKGSDGKYTGMVGTIVVGGGSTATATPSTVQTRVVPNPTVPPPTGRTAPARVAVTLETKEVVAQLADGTAYEFWTFNGSVPGPMLRVRVGDTVDLTLKNAANSLHAHSIDLHAVTGPGGGAKVTQTAAGQSSTFTFQALNPGLYVYHCATPHIPTHVANGMYGLIFVEPEEPLPPVDREYFVVQGEIYTAGDLGEVGLQTFSQQKMLDEEPEYFLLNGRVGALTGAGALQANVGETVRLYVGVGGFVPSSFHVIGEIFDRVWAEGAMSEPAEDVQTTLVPAGGSAIVEFKVEVPGDYLLVDHWLTHAIDRGAAGVLHVEGAPNPAVFRGTTTGDGGGH